ncbi:DUF2079 domain-containing protein [Streptomyces sp. NPDC001774]
MTLAPGGLRGPAGKVAPREGPGREGRAVWWGWAGIFFVLYTLFCLARHRNFQTTGYDLGIFTQAVRGYAAFGAPRSDLLGWDFNLYGDHFHPVLATLVPLYWLWPDARVLLLAQAGLLASSAVPLAGLAARRLGRGAGHAVAVSFGLSFGIQGAVAFDFHEVAFAAPMLSWGMAALAEGRYRAAFFWTLPLLAVKEDLGLTVAAVGMVFMIRRQVQSGLLLCAAGFSCFAVLIGVLIPAVNPSGAYPHFPLGGEEGLLSQLDEGLKSLFWHEEKTATLILTAGLTCGLALRSPLALAALPGIAVRFLSASPLYWGTGLHYSLTAMPVLFAAALDAQPRWARSRRAVFRGLGQHMAAAFLVAAAPLSGPGPLQSFLLHPARAFETTPQARAAHDLLRQIPDGATVEATNSLSPHLAHRTRVYSWPLTRRLPQYAVINLRDSWPAAPQDQHARAAELISRGYQLVAVRESIALLRQPG